MARGKLTIELNGREISEPFDTGPEARTKQDVSLALIDRLGGLVDYLVTNDVFTPEVPRAAETDANVVETSEEQATAHWGKIREERVDDGSEELLFCPRRECATRGRSLEIIAVTQNGGSLEIDAICPRCSSEVHVHSPRGKPVRLHLALAPLDPKSLPRFRHMRPFHE